MNFDVERHNIINVVKNIIGKAPGKGVQRVKLFTKPSHVKKNMEPKLEHWMKLVFRCISYLSTSQQKVDDILYQYSEMWTNCLKKFPNERLYVTDENLGDDIGISQEAESQMNASYENWVQKNNASTDSCECHSHSMKKFCGTTS